LQIFAIEEGERGEKHRSFHVYETEKKRQEEDRQQCEGTSKPRKRMKLLFKLRFFSGELRGRLWREVEEFFKHHRHPTPKVI